MVFKTMNISLIYLKDREGKSRRDDTLLTVGFNLRKRMYTLGKVPQGRHFAGVVNFLYL